MFSYVINNAFMLKSIKKIIKESLENEEWKKDVIYPMNKWIFTLILPYALGIICINFFLTIAAVSLVLYIFRINLKSPLSI